MMPTLLPHCESASARFTATVVLPTPPLPAPTAMMFLTPGTAARPAAGSDRLADARAHLHVDRGHARQAACTAARAWSRIWSLTGHAGVVSSIVNATRPPSIFRSLMKPRLTMSRFKIGIPDDLQRLEHACLINLHRPKNIVHSGATCHGLSRLADRPEIAASPNRGVMIVLAYLWLLALVPLLAEKQDPEIQWHAKHGIVLMAAELVLLFVYIVVTSLVSLASLGLGFILVLLVVFAWVGILGLHVLAILKGANGGRLIVPGVSRYADRW